MRIKDSSAQSRVRLGEPNIGAAFVAGLRTIAPRIAPRIDLGMALCVALCIGVPAVEGASREVVEVAPGVFVLPGPHGEASPENLGSFANVGFVTGTRSVAVIDTGGSYEFGRRLLARIREHTALPIEYVINTHVHPDHIFGNRAFEAPGVTFVGHHKLARSMAQRAPFYATAFQRLVGPRFAGTRAVPPSLVVRESIELDLGGRVLRVDAHPTAHTDNDLTVMDLKTRTLFLGDLLFMERLPVVDGSLKGWLALSQRLRQMDAARVVPGHGPASAPWPDSLVAQEDYLESLLGGIRQVIQKGGSIGEAVDTVGQQARSSWLLFDDNHPRNVTSSYTELEWE